MAAQPPPPTNPPAVLDPTSKSLSDFLNRARNPSPNITWDLSPFLTCPAVIARSKADAAPGCDPVLHVLAIPETAIPSPLAENLDPHRIWSLHEFLCGKVTGEADGNGNVGGGYGGFGGNERGREIWLSWKRAWDLWNNWYVEGRVNEVWVAGEWRRRERWERRVLGVRRERRMKQRGAGREDGLDDGSDLSFGGSDDGDGDGDGRSEHGSDVVFLRGGSGLSLGGNGSEDSHVEGTTPPPTKTKPPPTFTSQNKLGPNNGRLYWSNRGIPRAPAGKKWRLTGSTTPASLGTRENLEYEEVDESFVEPTILAPRPKTARFATPQSKFTTTSIPQPPRLTGPHGGPLRYQPTRPDGGLGTKWIFTGKTKTVLDYYEDPEWESVPTGNNSTVSDSTNPALPADQPAAVRNQRGRHNGDLRLENKKPVLQRPAGKKWIQTGRKEEGGLKRTEWEEVDKSFVATPQTAEEKAAKARADKIIEDQIKEGEKLLTTTVTGGFAAESTTNQRPKSTFFREPPEDEASAPPSPPLSPAVAGGGNDPPSSPLSSYDLSEPEPEPQPIGPSDDDDDEVDSDAEINHRTINRDGSSGGFHPIKLLKDYRLPEEDPAAGIFPEWQDVTSNSVWRPRRVGEKKLEIDLDEDIEDFWKNSDMEVWGGVDCGRSPYPALRSIIEHIHIKGKNTFKKKKVWDQVTGTLFNMPMRAVEPETEGDKFKRIKALYSNIMDDDPHASPDEIFPLDIRRVRRVDDKDEKPKELLEAGESLVTNRHTLQLPDPYPEMNSDDPWWVTPDQKQLRDVPLRHYPPNETPGKGRYLPVDDSLWREEVDNDEDYRARYFITNLKGGALLVNGMEVKRGCIAGPLPEFAVIECPGGQVAFWWGARGRFWGEPEEGPNGTHYESKWNTLRRMPGWDYVGIPAGDVWDWKFRDRKKREREGEDQTDDEDWQNWKRAKRIKTGKEEDKKKKKKLQKSNNNQPAPPPLAPPSSPPQGPTPPDAFRSENEELNWLTAQRLIKQSVRYDAQVPNTVIQPVGNSFWPGRNKAPNPVDTVTPHDVAEEIRVSDLLKAQKKLRDKEKADKDAKDAAAKAAADEKIRRREGTGYFPPDLDRIRRDHAEAARLRKVVADAQAKAADDVLVQRELVRKAETDAIMEAAIIAGMLREAPAGTTKEQMVQKRAQDKIDYDNDMEQRRVAVNVDRAKRGLPPFPPKQPLDSAAIEKAIADQRQAAQERKVRIAARAEDQTLARQRERAAKAAQDRRDREAARLKAQLAADPNKSQSQREAEVKAAADAAAAARRRATRGGSRRTPAPPGGSYRLPPPPPAPPRSQNTPGSNKNGFGGSNYLTGQQYSDYLAGFAADEDQYKKDLELATIMSLSSLGNAPEGTQAARQDALQALKSRAASCDLTADELLQDEGFAPGDGRSALDHYLDDRTRNEDRNPARFNDVMRQLLSDCQFHLGRAYTRGLRAQATLEGRSQEAIVQDRDPNITTVQEYIAAQMATVTMDDVPQPLPVRMEVPFFATVQEAEEVQRQRRIFNIEQGRLRLEHTRRWDAICRRIVEAGNWEAQTLNLPPPNVPDTNRTLEL